MAFGRLAGRSDMVVVEGGMRRELVQDTVLSYTAADNLHCGRVPLPDVPRVPS